MIETELRAALDAQSVRVPANVRWTLWLGGRGSTTSLHVDDQTFNVLYVLRGAKRVVLIDPAYEYSCTVPSGTPSSQPGACWAGVDVLSDTPSHARVVVLRRGEALVIPRLCATQNLEPTTAPLPPTLPR